MIVNRKNKLLKELFKNLKQNWIIYAMILPVLCYYFIFAYWPMYGVSLAFKEFHVKKGILQSPWIGFVNFQRFFSAYNFEDLLMNTLGLSLYTILAGFPIPIIFALFLNYLNNVRLKKFIQTVSYAPHFISTVVICGMVTIFCAPKTGAFNLLRELAGFESIDFLGKAKLFKHIYVWSGVWQSMGWNAIIYISALAGVDHEMHEAAIIDGATKLQRMRYIDIPSIAPTIIMLLILQFGSIMSVGFEKVYLLQNDLNRPSSSIISTYAYQVGMLERDYGYSTAISLFNNVINVILLITVNTFSKKVFKESLF